MSDVPHFSFPFDIADRGSAVVVLQDSAEEIEQNVKVLILTERGERLEVPDFGIEDPTFGVGVDTDAIVDAADKWDSRSKVFVDAEMDFVQRMVQNVRIHLEEQ